MKPDQHSSVEQWLDWLLSQHSQEIDLSLDRVRAVAEKMQLLTPDYKVISVAGTNGKGSSVAMLSSIYQQAGYQVGTYTSPHLIRFNERIQLNGQAISDQRIVDAFHKIELARGQIKITYFEFATLAALVVFQQLRLDVVVLEVGLGGRLDAVNMVDADVALITAIDIDHSEWLGTDRSLIALEKAGIMREARPAICSDPLVPQSLVDYALSNQVPLSRIGEQFRVNKNSQTWEFLASSSDAVREFPLPSLLGEFQVQNAAGVVATIDALAPSLKVKDSEIAEGLKMARHPGRIQQQTLGSQHWILDVAHNPQAADALAEYLQQIDFQGNAIFSVLADKDYEPMVTSMAPFIETWFIANLKVPRVEQVANIRDTLVKLGISSNRIVLFGSIADAVKAARGTGQSNWLVWGSLFTVGQTMQTSDFKGNSN